MPFKYVLAQASRYSIPFRTILVHNGLLCLGKLLAFDDGLVNLLDRSRVADRPDRAERGPQEVYDSGNATFVTILSHAYPRYRLG